MSIDPRAPIEAAGPPLSGRPIMHQWWRDITFVHWRVDPAAVAPLLPRGTRPDEHEGATYVGLIPFRMVGAGLGGGDRAVPWAGRFLETNVRLYSVDPAGRRGVVFCSLEAERLVVVAGANATFGVPYRWARMSMSPAAVTGDPVGQRIRYDSCRRRPHGPPRPSSRLEVEVGGAVADPTAEDLFVTARFGLHTRVLGRTWWVPNTHSAWPLHRARVLGLDDELVTAAGLPGVTAREPDSVLFSPGVRTIFGRPGR